MIYTISYGIPIRIYRLSTVYLPCINRISTVVYSGEIRGRRKAAIG